MGRPESCNRFHEIYWLLEDGSLEEGAAIDATAHLTECAVCRLRAEEAGHLINTYDAALSPRLSPDKAALLLAEATRTPRGRGRWLLPAAALLTIGFLLGAFWQERRTAAADPLGTGLLDAGSATDRLGGVYRLEGATSTAAMDTLIKTVLEDPSVNVRLAAIQTLGRFLERPQVREALMVAFDDQDHPATQLALVALYRQMDSAEAHLLLQRIAANPDLASEVRRGAGGYEG